MEARHLVARRAQKCASTRSRARRSRITKLFTRPGRMVHEGDAEPGPGRDLDPADRKGGPRANTTDVIAGCRADAGFVRAPELPRPVPACRAGPGLPAGGPGGRAGRER